MLKYTRHAIAHTAIVAEGNVFPIIQISSHVPLRRYARPRAAELDLWHHKQKQRGSLHGNARQILLCFLSGDNILAVI